MVLCGECQDGLSWKDIAWLMLLIRTFVRAFCGRARAILSLFRWPNVHVARLSDIVGTSVLTLNGVAVRALVVWRKPDGTPER